MSAADKTAPATAPDAPAVSITCLGTFTNPHAVHTVEELRAELEKANHALMAAQSRAIALEGVVRSIGQVMSDLVLAYLQGDGPKVADLLQNVVARNVRVMPNASSSLN